MFFLEAGGLIYARPVSFIYNIIVIVANILDLQGLEVTWRESRVGARKIDSAINLVL